MSKPNDVAKRTSRESGEGTPLRPVDLANLGLLRDPVDPDLDRIARLAAAVAQTNRAFISIVQKDTLHVVASFGSSVRSASLATSMCAYPYHSGRALQVPDLSRDPAFCELPQVKQADGNRFYAGFPLRMGGTPVGTLCVIDRKPRPSPLDDKTIRHLEDLAEVAVRILDTRLQEQRWRDYLEIASDWIWEQDEQYCFTYFSDRARERGVDIGRYLGRQRWDPALIGDAQEVFWGTHRATVEQHLPFSDFRYVWGTGENRHTASISGRPIFAQDGQFLGYRGIARDVTVEEAARGKVEYMARHDTLTGLLNRAAFETELAERFETRRQGGTPAALFLVDLDRFKQVNDTFGHAIGDELLVAAADRLRRAVTETAVVARIGGDEFAVIEPGLEGREAIEAYASTLVAALVEPYDLGERVEAGSSIGIAVLPDHGATPSQLVANADLALYAVKDSGRGRFRLFDRKLRRQADRRHKMSAEIAVAIEEGQFAVVYQPIIRLDDERIAAAEALLRWHHPTRGTLEPEAFLDALEAGHHAGEVGTWVLDQACRAAAGWAKTAPADFRISVNLFAAQLADPALTERVFGILDSVGLDGVRLDLEITEGLLPAAGPDLDAAFRTLRSRGVGLVFDDFGTGRATLGHLLRYPVGRIKVDRGFVRELGRNHDYETVTRALVHLAHDLGIAVTAKGIETEDQKSFVASIGCQDVQGFYFARPMSAQALGEILADPSCDLRELERRHAVA